MLCNKCGKEVSNNVRFCTFCGNPLGVSSGGVSVKRRSSSLWIKKVIICCLAVMIAAGGVIAYVMLSSMGDTTTGGQSPKSASSTGTAVESADEPTDEPTEEPTQEPTEEPTEEPVEEPTEEPTEEPVEEPTEEPTKEPVQEPEAEPFDMSAVSTVSATSQLSENGLVYPPEQVCDGDLSKAWVEGATGQGIGESIIFNLDGEYLVKGLNIYNGYQKSRDLFYKNSRPQKIRIDFSDGSHETIELKDKMGLQRCLFQEPAVTNRMTVTIENVYAGEKYSDTAISEMSWY